MDCVCWWNIKQVLWFIQTYKCLISSPFRDLGERGGSVVECRTPEREVRGSRPTAAVLCPWARHFTPWKYWLITQEAMAPSRHDWKIVDWDVKPQHNQPTFRDFTIMIFFSLCKNFDEKLRTMLDDAKFYLHCEEEEGSVTMATQSPFNKYQDTPNLLSYIQTSCVDEING